LADRVGKTLGEVGKAPAIGRGGEAAQHAGHALPDVLAIEAAGIDLVRPIFGERPHPAGPKAPGAQAVMDPTIDTALHVLHGLGIAAQLLP
jgi:hypothetical protein